MKFKTFDKVNVAVEYEIKVFHEDEPIDYFKVNYLVDTETNNIYRKEALKEKGAVVRFVSVNSANGLLSLTLEV